MKTYTIKSGSSKGKVGLILGFNNLYDFGVQKETRPNGFTVTITIGGVREYVTVPEQHVR